jgi:energy-coupling factor transport system ATP-binding protein
MIPIELRQVSFVYPSGVTALRDVSLRIEAGESVALIGENGAGKTTLARHLNGLLQPTGGVVMIGDWTTADTTVARLARRVGYVFQNPDQQIFKRTVRDEVAFGPRNLGFDAAEVDRVVEDALAATELIPYAERHPHDLLPAQRKYVALASVLAMRTPIVVLDEPTTGQDVVGMHLMNRILVHLRSEGRTLIIISHDMDFSADNCDRFVVLDEGQVLLDGSVEHVFSRPELLARSSVEPPQLARLAARLDLPLAWQVPAFLRNLQALQEKP